MIICCVWLECPCYVGLGRPDTNIAFGRRGVAPPNPATAGWVEPRGGCAHSSQPQSRTLAPNQASPHPAMLAPAAPTQTLRLGGVAAPSAGPVHAPCGGRPSRATLGVCPLEPTTQPGPNTKPSLAMLLLCWPRPPRPKHCVWAAWQHQTLWRPAGSSHKRGVPTRANHAAGLPQWWPAAPALVAPLRCCCLPRRYPPCCCMAAANLGCACLGRQQGWLMGRRS